MKKVTKYDLATIIIFSIISESDIFSYFIKNKIGSILDIILRLSFIVYIFYVLLNKNLGKISLKKVSLKSLLILPLFVVCFSNYFVILFESKSITNPYTFNLITFIKIILTALCEELTYRALLYKEIEKYNKPIKSLLISSLIFGLIHLANINSLGSILPCMLQSIYSFGIGLMVGFLYLYTDNIIFSFIFHFLFNLFNGEIIPSIYTLDYSLMFFVVNIMIAILACIYALILLKGEDYAATNMDN